MKKEGLFLLIFILSICFVSSTHIAKIEGGNSVSIEEEQAHYYNFSIENTGDKNITLVNITLPTSLRFRATTEITDAFFQSFSNTSDTLTWNNSANYLVGVNGTKYFAFVGEAKTAGIYQIIISTLDSDGDYSSVIDLEIFTISSCASNWSCGAWSGCQNNFQTRTCTDLNSCNNTSTKPIEQKYCSTENCIQNWSCSNWSVCSGGAQLRTCIDLNSCNNLTGKPNETQTCLSSCTPAYSCTEWSPSKCDKDQIQTRVCIDSNDCGSVLNKPEESRGCKSDSLLFFIILVSIISTGVIFFVILLVFKIKNYFKNDKENSQDSKISFQRPYKNNPRGQLNSGENQNNSSRKPL